MILTTERLTLTELTMDMAEVIHHNSLDEDNRRFVPDEVFETIDEAREAVSFLMSQYETKDGPLLYPVLISKTDENIGYVQLVPLGSGKWEVGYHIARRYTGRGYAVEAVRAFLPTVTRLVGIDQVEGICLKENAASIRVMEKCGFRHVFDGPGEYQGEIRPVVKMNWSREE